VLYVCACDPAGAPGTSRNVTTRLTRIVETNAPHPDGDSPHTAEIRNEK
jgi:hypothetical protein